MSSVILLGHCADLMRLGMQAVLSECPEFQIGASVNTLEALLSATQKLRPQMVIFDQCLDSQYDAKIIVHQLRLKSYNTYPLVIGSIQNGMLIRDVLASGALGYLFDGDDLQECLIGAVKSVMQGQMYLSPTASAEYLTVMQSEDRDWQMDNESYMVLQLLAQGEHVMRIGERLGITKRRVYWVREKLRRRFGAKTNEHLIQRATAEGFIYPRD